MFKIKGIIGKINRFLSRILIFSIILFGLLGLNLECGSKLIPNQYIFDEGKQKDLQIQFLTSEGLSEDWSEIWGDYNTDTGKGIAVAPSGDVFVAGYTNSYGEGNYDFFFINFNPIGNILFNKTWGGPLNDQANGIANDSSGNFYVVGWTESFGAGSRDLALVKYHWSGTRLWNKTWGGSGGDYGFGIAVDSAGDIYLVGSTESFGIVHDDLAVVKFYSNGTKAWNATWGDPNYNCGYAIAVDSLGNVYATGTDNFEPYKDDLVLVKFFPNGTLAWNTTWGGSNQDIGNAIIPTADGGICVVGQTSSFGLGSGDFALVKFDSNGTRLWNTTWGGSGNDIGYSVALDSAGNIYAGGTTGSFGAGKADFAVVKFHPNGTKDWNFTWGNSLNNYGYGLSIDAAGDIYAVGETWISSGQLYDVAVVKFADAPPQSNHPSDKIVNQHSSDSIEWILIDDMGAGYYRVFVNDTPSNWMQWTNGVNISYPINTSISGVFNYTIQFNDSTGYWGTSDTVFITISAENTTNPIPSFSLMFLAIILTITAFFMKKKSKKHCLLH